ncbi:DUF6838 family protein [Paenibacillus sp. FSL H7-0331]|uniref:phage tail terminator family protein n=1 Tax=Paenibacillus sp. FSL H7-0331 TaxID=1920421 RepID=UPI0015C2DD4A|nr:hypothetical protein [Paenibacillus sp. FSL H7-0331]
MKLVISEDIKSGMLARLEELEPGYGRYNEQMPGDAQKPAFLVSLVDSTQQKEINRRYRRSMTFAIQFFPDPGSLTQRADCLRMGERLYSQLECVVSDNILYRGSGMKYEVVDEELQFNISFSIRLIHEQETVPSLMETIEQEGHIR